MLERSEASGAGYYLYPTRFFGHFVPSRMTPASYTLNKTVTTSPSWTT